MTSTWVVLLEMARLPYSKPIEPELIRQMLMALAPHDPSALRAADRYALQLRVLADDPASAITVAQSRLSETIRRLRVPPWELVRAEAVTQAEYDEECDERAVAGRALGTHNPGTGRLSPRGERQRAGGRCGRRGD